MASLAGEQLKDTYDSLLKTSDNDALVSGSYKEITDGSGNGSNLYLGQDGNVGIGVSPVRNLHVDGGSISADTPTLRISSTDSSGTNKFGIEFFSNSGSDVRGKLLADNNGKVYLDDNGGGGVILQGNGGTGGVGIGGSPSTFANYTNVSIKGGSSGSNLDFFNSSGTRVGAIVSNPSTDFIIETNEATPLVFKTNSNPAMRIDSSGNVGIGTDSPAVPSSNATTLHIKGAVATKGGAVRLSSSDDSVDAYLYPSSSSFNIGSITSHDVNIVTNNSPRMTIDSSGNVGIGQTNPSTHKLHVASGASFASLALFENTGSGQSLVQIKSPSASIIEFGDNDDGNVGAIQYFHADNSMRFKTADNERMRIDSSGRVGIGETNPDRELDLKNSADNCIMSITSSTSHLSGLVLGDTADDDRGGILYNNTSDYLYFLSNAQERLRILSGGGITFNGDTATANALDDYEEGTWTPVYTPANNSFTTMTMNVVSATYTKIGRQVTARAYITTNEVVVGTASGGLNIDGLPFTSASGNDGFSSVSIGYVTNWGTVPNTGYVRSNNTEIRLRRSTGANDSSPSDLTTGATANQNQIMITATYFV
jgi:hypothetical protein